MFPDTSAPCLLFSVQQTTVYVVIVLCWILEEKDVSLGTRKESYFPLHLAPTRCSHVQSYSFRSDVVSQFLSAVTVTVFPGKTGQASSLASWVGAQLTAIFSCQPLELLRCKKPPCMILKVNGRVMFLHCLSYCCMNFSKPEFPELGVSSAQLWVSGRPVHRSL